MSNANTFLIECSIMLVRALIILAVLSVASCTGPNRDDFLMTEDLGLGVTLGTKHSNVIKVLGEPAKQVNPASGRHLGLMYFDYSVGVVIDLRNQRVTGIHVYDVMAPYIRDRLKLFDISLSRVTPDVILKRLPNTEAIEGLSYWDLVLVAVLPLSKSNASVFSESETAFSSVKLSVFFSNGEVTSLRLEVLPNKASANTWEGG